MRQLPPLSGLQAFEAAARHLSFTDAARELNCTQAAISQRVRALEVYLSRRLFVRKSNGLQLSEVGEAYLPGVAEALNAAAAATEGLRRRRLPRAVTISAPVSFLTLWLAPRLAALPAQLADIELRLNSSIWTDPNAELADISVQVREQVEIEPGLPRLPAERLMLVGAPRMAKELAAKSVQAGLKTWRKIVIQGRHDLWQRWRQELGVELTTGVPALKVDNAVTALEAAGQGLGVTVAYSTYCSPFLTSGRLVGKEAATVQTSLSHVLIGPSNRSPWHPSHKVFEFLNQEFSRTPTTSA